MNDAELLSSYRESLKIAWGYNDYSDWPIKLTSIMHLFAGDLAMTLVDDINHIFQRGGSQKIGELFVYPGRIFRLIDVIQFGLRINRTGLDIQRDVAVKLIKSAIGLKRSDLFSLNKSNLLIDYNLDRDILTHYIDENAINQFHAALFLYCESMFFRGHDAGKAIHGPYRSNNNSNVIVREFYNLCDNPLWSDDYKIPFNKITTICEYNNNVAIGIDLYDHLSYEGTIKGNLIGSCVVIDGIPIIDPKQIGQYTQNIIKKSNMIQNEINKWDWKKIARQYANIFWFRAYPIKKFLNVECNPSEEVFKKINNGSINDIRLKTLSPKEVALLIQLGV